MDLEEKNEIITERNKIAEAELLYVNGEIDNLVELVEHKKQELMNNIENYMSNYKGEFNPAFVNMYFFKSVNPVSNREPSYNGDKLSIVWELYKEILMNVNFNIGTLIPTLSSFCKFSGITTQRFRSLMKSDEADMRIICEKINDEIFDLNVTLAQYGKVKEQSTMYRMKAENKKIEKEQPQIHIHNDGGIDIEAINKRLQELQGFNDRKQKVLKSTGEIKDGAKNN